MLKLLTDLGVSPHRLRFQTIEVWNKCDLIGVADSAPTSTASLQQLDTNAASTSETGPPLAEDSRDFMDGSVEGRHQ